MINRPIKIAMVAACPFPYPRGTPVRILRMAEALGKRGHEVHVITYHLGEEIKDIPFKIHRIPDVKTYRKYSPGPTYQKLFFVDPLLAVKLFQFLTTWEIDLIHAHNYEGLFVSFCVKKWTKHPLVYDAHTLLESEFPFYEELGLPEKIKKGIAQRFDRLLPKRSDHIITVTERIKSKLIQDAGVAPENITVITNGVESELFDVVLDGYESSKNDKKTIVFSGNLAPYQGIDLLLKAFKQVLDGRRNTRLLIISDFPFNCYEPLANALKIREYIDVVSSEFKDLPQYLAGADIALNPRTDCDGIPQKLLNYMAAAKPIVSFEGSAKSIEHGKTGWIVENGNVAAFAKAILFLLENPLLAQRLGENAREYVTSKHTWEKVAEETEVVYEHIFKNRKPK
ncbi:MAG TPA: glycosyltransferase family 4 protein [Thermodesulfobacteriota bacterium]|nr:glycosyltransferase family 4 protein [Thermodesulfobacteriota bacterium]